MTLTGLDKMATHELTAVIHVERNDLSWISLETSVHGSHIQFPLVCTAPVSVYPVV